MTRGELLDKLEEFKFRANEIEGELEDIKDECEDLYWDITELIKEVEEDDNER